MKTDYKKFDANKKVGPILPLYYIIENNYKFQQKYQKEMQEKYDRLKNYIYNLRTVYRDGNSYYRAVIFRYIELLILNKKVDIIKQLIIDINNCFQSPEIKQRLNKGKEILNSKLILQIMITILELVDSDKIIEAHLVFYKALLFRKIFDYSFILYFRYIIYSYIKENENKLYSDSFPVLIGNLLPEEYEKNGKFDFHSFYQNHLLKINTSAEKIVIYLTPFVLGIKLEEILFEYNEKEVIKTFKFVGESQLNIDDSIFILNRIGHYEIIYNYKDNQKYDFIYNYYTYLFKSYFIKLDFDIISESNNVQYKPFFQQNHSNNYIPQSSNNNKINYQTMYNSQRNTNNNNPPFGGNVQNPNKFSQAQMFHNENLLNQNNYYTNYNQNNYYNNNNNSNYNNNFILKQRQNINYQENRELNRANSLQIDKNNHNDKTNLL